jgi:hypothetical protein
MINKDLWAQSEGKDRMLCIGCLEKRIGRLLTPDDFPKHIPLNEMIIEGSLPASYRLLSRIK